MNDRRDHRDELTQLIEDFFQTMPSAAVTDLLDRAGIANGRLNSPRELLEHEQLKHRDRWRSVGTPNGPVQALKPPFAFTDIDPVMSDVPALGSHTDEILQNLGYSVPEIVQMKANSIA